MHCNKEQGKVGLWTELENITLVGSFPLFFEYKIQTNEAGKIVSHPFESHCNDTGLSLKYHLEFSKIRIFEVHEDRIAAHEMLSFCAHDVRVLCLPRTFSCSCFLKEIFKKILNLLCTILCFVQQRLESCQK